MPRIKRYVSLGPRIWSSTVWVRQTPVQRSSSRAGVNVSATTWETFQIFGCGVRDEVGGAGAGFAGKGRDAGDANDRPERVGGRFEPDEACRAGMGRSGEGFEAACVHHLDLEAEAMGAGEERYAKTPVHHLQDNNVRTWFEGQEEVDCRGHSRAQQHC